MKLVVILFMSAGLFGCGIAEKADKSVKRQFKDDLSGEWEHGCFKFGDKQWQKHFVNFENGSEFSFTTKRYSDDKCKKVDLLISYAGVYKIGDFKVKKDASGRETKFSFEAQALLPLTAAAAKKLNDQKFCGLTWEAEKVQQLATDKDNCEIGEFKVGQTHNVILKIEDELLKEYTRSGKELRTYEEM